MSQSVLYPLLAKEDFEQEKNVVLTEIIKTKDNIDREVQELTIGAAFEKNMSMRIVGIEKTVKGLRHEDVLNNYETFYHPGNAILAISTSIKKDIILERAEKHFSNWQTKEQKILPRKDFINHKEKLVFWGKDAKSFHLSFGIETIKKDSGTENNALKIIRFILSDRLFEELRTKRSLVYSARVMNNLLFANNSFFYCKTEFDKSKYKEVVRETIKVIQGLKNLEDKELEIAKNNVAAYSIFSYENPKNLSFASTYFLLYTGEPFDPEKEREDICKVTKKDVIKTAKKFLNVKNMSFVLAGNIDDKMKKFLGKATS